MGRPRYNLLQTPFMRERYSIIATRACNTLPSTKPMFGSKMQGIVCCCLNRVEALGTPQMYSLSAVSRMIRVFVLVGGMLPQPLGFTYCCSASKSCRQTGQSCPARKPPETSHDSHQSPSPPPPLPSLFSASLQAGQPEISQSQELSG